MDSKVGDLWYRIDDSRDYNGIRLEVKVYRVTKCTPKGYWLVPSYSTGYFHSFDKHWVSKDSRKKFAYPTVAEAKESFLARKRRQIDILTHQLNSAKIAERLGNGIDTEELKPTATKLIKSSADSLWFMPYEDD